MDGRGSSATGQKFHDTGLQASADGGLDFFISEGENQIRPVLVPGAVRTNEWYHLAASAGADGMKLFLDGALIGTNRNAGGFGRIRNGAGFRLGRSIVNVEPFVDGQLAEVRVWKVARTEAQIREAMFRPLTGKEPGLAGLWNFEDGTAHDASPGGHHGELRGGARITSNTPGAAR